MFLASTGEHKMRLRAPSGFQERPRPSIDQTAEEAAQERQDRAAHISHFGNVQYAPSYAAARRVTGAYVGTTLSERVSGSSSPRSRAAVDDTNPNMRERSCGQSVPAAARHSVAVGVRTASRPLEILHGEVHRPAACGVFVHLYLVVTHHAANTAVW